MTSGREMGALPDTPGALSGVLVADFSRVLAGPYATMLLGDLGAEVIKIERAGKGDDTRTWGPPFVGEDSTYFAAANRNKRSLELDLGRPEHRRAALALAGRSDVLVENFRPGAMSRLGLGYDDVRRVNERIVYCTISGFGLKHGARLAGYDLLVQSVGGLMSITGPEPGMPTKTGVALVDVITGLHAAVGVLAAIRHRDRTGEGQHVTVNLLSSLLSALTNQASGFVSAGVVPEIMGNRHPSVAPYETFPTKDRPLTLAVGNDGQYRALCSVLGREDMAVDPRFSTNPARVAHREALFAELAAAFAEASADVWFERLTSVGVPCGPINDIAEAFELAERLGLEPIVTTDAGHGTASRQVANPIGMSATPPTYRLDPPRLGEGTASILAQMRQSADPDGRPVRHAGDETIEREDPR